MSLRVPLVLSKVVENDLCIGCGACVQACQSKALDVSWNKYGFLVATSTGKQCDTGGIVSKFAPSTRILGRTIKMKMN